ncbi:hypothetical protein KKC06_05635, partial [Patescibacteria group bacterium]|nr:hypothetical protein [Patescibacteria group bacterium]
ILRSCLSPFAKRYGGFSPSVSPQPGLRSQCCYGGDGQATEYNSGGELRYRVKKNKIFLRLLIISTDISAKSASSGTAQLNSIALNCIMARVNFKLTAATITVLAYLVISLTASQLLR